jgi:hypothetical protein
VNGAEPPPEILAALFWDVPLLRAGSPSARDFAAALRGQAERWWEPKQYGTDALGRAAQGVASERASEPSQAAELYATLISDGEPWVRLLGLMLRAWSASEEGPDVITEARLAAREFDPPPEVSARLLAKLATNAFDEGEIALGKELLDEAITVAPMQTKLRRALAIEGLNAGLPHELSEQYPLLPPDPLVDYPWIRYETLAAAQATLSGAVETHSQRLWTVRWRAGRTSVDDVVSAEVQASWAGALWLRRPIRKQLGAQLLTGAATTPQQWAYGVIMWVLGAGGRPERAYALAEPSLDQEASDLVVRTLGAAEIAPSFMHRFLSVAVEAWDGLSEDTLRWAVSRVEPAAGDHPDATRTQRLWAGFAARLEEEWQSQFTELSEPVRVSQLEMLGVDAVKRFSAASREAVFETAVVALRTQETVSTHLLRVLADVAPPSLDDELRDAISDKASASVIAHLAYEEHHPLIRPGDRARARRTLITALREQSAEARRGSVSFGSTDLRIDLGRLVAGSPEQDADAVALLMATAVDPSLPGEHIMYARAALTLVRRAGKLEATTQEALHEADDPLGTLPEHGDTSAQLLRVRRLQILALDLTSGEAISVVGACRAEDPRVRQVALVTAGEAVGASGEVAERDALSWALVGGLFDPVDAVVGTATGAVSADFLEHYRAAGRVAMERLPRLLSEGGVQLRATVAMLVHRWIGDNPDLASDPVIQSMLVHAGSDRSWIVRTAGRR